MYKLGLEKAEKPEIKLPTFVESQRKQGNFRNISTSASLSMLNPLTQWIYIYIYIYIDIYKSIYIYIYIYIK